MRKQTEPTEKQRYPAQFWVMTVGVAVASLGVTMIWPFMMIFTSERLGLPMASVTSLMTINSICGLFSSIIVGPILDRYGRKTPMMLGYVGNAIVYLGYLGASQYWHFALCMALTGLAGPFMRVGASAMIADMFSGEQRTHAFAVYRMVNNIGFGSGPILGGLALQTSYNFGLIAAAVSIGLQALLTLFFVPETLEPDQRNTGESILQNLMGMLQALKDKILVHMLAASTLQEICARMVWVLLAVYAKVNFGISEVRYGFIPTVNALMVVLLQVIVTQVTRKHREPAMMGLGAALYTLAHLMLALASGFWGLMAAMVVLTFGELIIAPTSTVFVANLAPPDKRGRYLGIYGLIWYVSLAIGPLFAGIMTDTYGPRAPWYGGMVIGLLSVIAFISLDRRSKNHQPA